MLLFQLQGTYCSLHLFVGYLVSLTGNDLLHYLYLDFDLVVTLHARFVTLLLLLYILDMHSSASTKCYQVTSYTKHDRVVKADKDAMLLPYCTDN